MELSGAARRGPGVVIVPRPWALTLAEAVLAVARSRRDGEDADPGVFTTLYTSLGTLIGPTGFDVVLSRALTLAQRAEPRLNNVAAAPGGVMTGFGPDPIDVEKGQVRVLSHLVELLVRFIGDDLVLRIFRDTWPNMPDPAGTKEMEL